MNKNKKSLPSIFLIIALICANGGIIISLMYLVFHFIDCVNFAVGFLANDFTKVIMLINSIISLVSAASVMIILHFNESKSYFFRKVAFITFWLCVFYALIHLDVILPDVIEKVYLKLIWFSISLFTMVTSIFCVGLLVMVPQKKQKPKNMTSPLQAEMGHSMNNISPANPELQNQNSNFSSFESIEIGVTDNSEFKTQTDVKE
jgi:hypothetical protein